MAPGPAPAEQRRRRNEPARGEWQDLAPIEEPILPELPDDTEDLKWTAAAREAWGYWRRDPATALYTPGEIGYALDTITIYNGKGPTPEVRLRMDGLGLTPKGKRDLRYRVNPDLEPATVSEKKHAQRTRARSRRNRLSVVK